MVNGKIVITITRPQGVFQMTGELESFNKLSERWEIEMRATTAAGRNVAADLTFIHVHRREARSMLESARFLLERSERK